jgi:hypothetical protein
VKTLGAKKNKIELKSSSNSMLIWQPRLATEKQFVPLHGGGVRQWGRRRG